MPTLDWLNRAAAFTTAAQLPYCLREPVSSHGDAQHAADNRFIQGDNLEALKALLPFYRGPVKCIFIDPPYNTKSAFEHYDDNLEHIQWRSMMPPRLQKVVDGEQGGISQAVGWQGGLSFARLGAPIFDADGCIHPGVRFATLAAFIWQQGTGTALYAAQGQGGTPYLGTYTVFDGCLRLPDGRERPIFSKISDTPEAPPVPVLQSRTAYYLLFNGILSDKRPTSGNVLTSAVLESLLALHASTAHPEAPQVVYGEACRLGPARLAQARVVFKHIPYDVKAR